MWRDILKSTKSDKKSGPPCVLEAGSGQVKSHLAGRQERGILFHLCGYVNGATPAHDI